MVTMAEVVWEDLKLSDKLSITQPAAVWVMFCEFIAQIDDEDRSPAVIAVGNAVWEAISDAAWRKAAEAKHAEEPHPMMAQMHEALGRLGFSAVDLPGSLNPEDFGTPEGPPDNDS